MKPNLVRKKSPFASTFARATIASVDGAALELRLGDAGPAALVRGRVGFVPGYLPTPGDRVVVVEDEGEPVVVGVLRAAQRDLALEAQGEVRISGRALRVEADETRFVGRLFAVTAARVRHDAERVELVAERVIEKAREVVREASELVELRAGRMRTLVAGVFDVRSRRTVLRSEEDTSIDGRKILLG